MNEVSDKNFGLLIAYVLPGFVTLWGLRARLPLVDEWLSPSPTIPAGVESLFFVVLASTASGLIVSALRWALLDTLHHATGMPRPAWDDAKLATHLQPFNAVVDWHYRHYQFYANMAVALAGLFAVHFADRSRPEVGVIAGFIALELLLVAASRDTLGKYYARATGLLASLPRAERTRNMVNGSHPPKPPAPAEPPTERKKPSDTKK